MLISNDSCVARTDGFPMPRSFGARPDPICPVAGPCVISALGYQTRAPAALDRLHLGREGSPERQARVSLHKPAAGRRARYASRAFPRPVHEFLAISRTSGALILKFLSLSWYPHADRCAIRLVRGCAARFGRDSLGGNTVRSGAPPPTALAGGPPPTLPAGAPPPPAALPLPAAPTPPPVEPPPAALPPLAPAPPPTSSSLLKNSDQNAIRATIESGAPVS